MEEVEEAYGFVPDLQASLAKNTQRVLGDMPAGHYFQSPHKMAFHDLTPGKSLPPAARLILGLSNKFIPVPKFAPTRKRVMEAFERFERMVNLKDFFAGSGPSDFDRKSKLYVRSNFRPGKTSSVVNSRLYRFEIELRRLFYKRRGRSNLTPFQNRLLSKLQANDSVVIAQADKNLGPVAVALDRYIKDALAHLQDKSTYTIISEEQAQAEAKDLRQAITDWAHEYHDCLTPDQAKYLRVKLEDTKADPFGYFYLLYKLHKSPISTRPVCSDCASLPHALGQWVDEMLQPIVQAQHTYFKDSYSLKLELDKLLVPPNSSILSFDAVLMYTNIDTSDCITRLSTYLRDPSTTRRFTHYSPDCLIDAITIVMLSNRMRFGDIIAKQIRGIAMGMAPAPSIANLYVAIHEQANLLTFLTSNVLLLRRFIDDGLAIWIHDQNPATDRSNWQAFRKAVTSGGLDWTFTERSKTVDFMDMTISIVDGHIDTTLFEKPLALHLYLPPHSCHAPGVTTSTVMGKVLRVFQLCSHEADIRSKLCSFFGQLLDRGHQAKQLTSLFNRAIVNAKGYLRQTPSLRERLARQREREATRRVYLHLPYHPANPPSKILQQLWQNTIFSPPGEKRLNQLVNHKGAPIPVDRMIIAYSRAPNLGNMLSYRKICNRSGPKVSSYLD